MKINIASVLKSDGASQPFSGSLELGSVEFMGSPITFTKPLEVKGSVYGLGDMIEISASIEGEYTAQCSRCGEETTKILSTTLSESVRSDFSDADEECLSLTGNVLCITGALEACIFGSIPIKILCKDTCKGLCSVCGTNRNKKDCNCDETVYDPRFAIFRNLQQRGVENGSSEE